MTEVTTERGTESFESALQRARIRVLCGGSDKEIRELICLKKIERIVNREYCISGVGTIQVENRA